MASHSSRPPSTRSFVDPDLRLEQPKQQRASSTNIANIAKLEESAEQLSLNTNIGEEIRKIREEQKRRDSRSSAHSTFSAHQKQGQWQGPVPTRHSSGAKSRSRANSNAVRSNAPYTPQSYTASPVFPAALARTDSHSQTTGSHSQTFSPLLPELEQDSDPWDLFSTYTSYMAASTSEIPRPLFSPSEDPAIQPQSPNEALTLIEQADLLQAEIQKWRSPEAPTLEPAVVDGMASKRGSQLKVMNPDEDTAIYDNFASTAESMGLSKPSAPRPPLRQPETLAKLEGRSPPPPTGATEINMQADMITPRSPEKQTLLEAPQELPSRSTSFASKTTSQKAASVFKDFDGVHYTSVPSNVLDEDMGLIPEESDAELVEDELHEEIEDDFEPPSMARQSFMPWAAPPPSDGMVFYPAPVPSTLNLPKRLSQQIIPPQQEAYRRSRVLGPLPEEARRSVAWLPPVEGQTEDDLAHERHPDSPERPKRDSQLRNSVPFNPRLPPQLRASVFFEHPSVTYEVEVQDGSAMNTLDALLDASATAPVEPLEQEKPTAKKAKRQSKGPKRPAGPKRTSTITLLEPETEQDTPQTDSRPVSMLSVRHSSADLLKTRKSYNRLSLVGELNEDDEFGHTHGQTLTSRQPLEPGYAEDHAHVDEDQHHDHNHDYDHEGEEEYEDEDEDEDEEGEDEEEAQGSNGNAEIALPNYAIPATLLAELQLRKEQLKQRNRTAVTAYPNGMHSTLLELDAVAQIEKRYRQKKHTRLAWEDPGAAINNEDLDHDDVPLGLLFPTQKAQAHGRDGADWDRPLGLIEKKNFEENEPLSRRRNRLKGLPPNGMSNQADKSATGLDQDESDPELAGETLAQRTRRLKSKKALDEAIEGEKTANGHSRNVSEAFSLEMLSQIGALEETAKEAAKDTNRDQAAAALEGEVAEETLGQRRQRLQAERATIKLVRDFSGSGVPPQILSENRADQSLASLLAASPIPGARVYASPAGQQPASGLVGQNEFAMLARKQQLYESNYRTLSGSGGAPLIDASNIAPAGARREMSKFSQFNNGSGGAEQLQRERVRSAVMGVAGGFTNSNTQLAPSPMMMNMKNASSAMLGGGIYPSAAANASTNRVPSHAHPQAAPAFARQSSMTAAQAHRYAQSPFAAGAMSNAGYGLPQQNMPHAGMGIMQGSQVYDEAAITSTQRDTIDRWRQSIAP